MVLNESVVRYKSIYLETFWFTYNAFYTKLIRKLFDYTTYIRCFSPAISFVLNALHLLWLAFLSASLSFCSALLTLLVSPRTHQQLQHQKFARRVSGFANCGWITSTVQPVEPGRQLREWDRVAAKVLQSAQHSHRSPSTRTVLGLRFIRRG